VSGKNTPAKRMGLILICLLPTVFLPAGSEAQQLKFARIGYLSTTDRSRDSARIEAIRLARLTIPPNVLVRADRVIK